MEVLISALIGIAIIVAIVMFFSPLIIISQLNKIISQLRIQNENHRIQHQELLNMIYSYRLNNNDKEKKAKDDRDKELMKSLFQDEKNTPD